MAEETIKNKTLLIVAGVMGLVAVGLFYAYDRVQNNRFRGNQVEVLKWTQALKPGESIRAGHLTAVKITRTQAQALKAVEARDRMSFENTKVFRAVQKDTWVQYDDVLKSSGDFPSNNISKGGRGMPLEIDSNLPLGDLVQPGDFVDVVGTIAMPNDPAKGMVLMQRVRVISVGGVSATSAGRTSAARASYRTICVDVSPAVADKWASLKARMKGKIWLLVRNRDDDSDIFSAAGKILTDKDGQPFVINPALDPLLSQDPVESESSPGGDDWQQP